jgi:flagellar hook-length control protein FliK
MADLAVTAHQHALVASPTRSGNDGGSGDTRSAIITSFEQLLKGSINPSRSLPSAADGLRAEREPVDRGDRAAGRSAAESARPPGKRFQARPAPTAHHDRATDAAPPVRRAADGDQNAPGDSDAVRRRDAQSPGAPAHERADEARPGEQTGRRRTRPPADPSEHGVPLPLTTAPQPVVPGMAGNAATPLSESAAQAGAPAPGIPRPPFGSAADAAPQTPPAPPAMTAPASGQAASITREADMLVSQPAAALAPAAVLATESIQGLRLRPATSTPASQAVSEPTATAAGTSQTAADVAAAPGVAARAAGGPHAAAIGSAGGADATAGAVSLPGTGQTGPGPMAPGQKSEGGSAATAVTTAGGGAAVPSGKSPTAASTGGAAGIAEGAALGGAQTPGSAGRTAAPSPLAPGAAVQQRMISDQVSVHIRKAVHEGADRIEIRLKPEALGRVDVRLEMGADNRVVATVTADQRHTLELLRADARSLERALQEAGLQTDGGSLNFNLRGGEDGRPGPHDRRATAHSLHDSDGTAGEPGQESPPQAYGRPAGRPDGIDIRA